MDVFNIISAFDERTNFSLNQTKQKPNTENEKVWSERKLKRKLRENFFSFIICIHATNDPFDDDEKGYKSSLPQFIEFRDGARLMNRRFTGVRGLMNLKSNYPRDECLLLMFIANQSAVLSVFPSVVERWCDGECWESVDFARCADCDVWSV